MLCKLSLMVKWSLHQGLKPQLWHSPASHCIQGTILSCCLFCPFVPWALHSLILPAPILPSLCVGWVTLVGRGLCVLLLSFTNIWASQLVLVVKNLPSNARDIRKVGLILESERSPGGGHGNQYSCLENSMDRGAWQATVHGITKNRTRLSDCHCHLCVYVNPKLLIYPVTTTTFPLW